MSFPNKALRIRLIAMKSHYASLSNNRSDHAALLVILSAAENVVQAYERMPPNAYDVGQAIATLDALGDAMFKFDRSISLTFAALDYEAEANNSNSASAADSGFSKR